ncbi:MAG: RNA pyrophosphohydrolase [Sphingomonadaceae bacterium]
MAEPGNNEKREGAQADREELPYRPAAGVMLLNRDGKVFVGQRSDTTLEAWQMPQGGIDEGEDEREAALRELEEETGIAPDKIEIICRCPDYLYYDLPDDLVGKMWGGKYRGQRQTWYLARFTGSDADVAIDRYDDEFRAWKWAEPEELPAMILPFKKKLYEELLERFRDWL